MCGIFGGYNTTLEETKKGIALINRGNDGITTSRLTEKIFFAARRHAIKFSGNEKNLFGNSDQPYYSDDKNIALIFNGEFYNFSQYKDSLIKKKINFKTAGDTEVLLKLYETFGINFLRDKKIDSLYSIAIHDKKLDKIFISRDWPGRIPIYYYHEKDRFIMTRRQHSDCYLLFTIRNNTQAMQACEPLATAGDAKAQHHMAKLTMMRNDFTAAAEWATRSAAQRYAPGQLVLGQLYQDGRGVGKDPVRAHGLMKSAADQGLPEAAYHTGLSFKNGSGVRADEASAERYLEKAASGGHMPAYFALAELHETSQPARYRYWLDQAARKGSARAQFMLGESFAQGSHGPTDNEAAYVWYSLALLNGNQDARAGIDEQEKLLTSSQLSAARSRVEDGINGRWD